MTSLTHTHAVSTKRVVKLLIRVREGRIPGVWLTAVSGSKEV